ncbi:hypothetical protein Ahia01_001263900 [Argonauta hians]
MMMSQGNITVSALKARFDTPLSNKADINTNTTRKISDRNSKFKPHSASDKITNSSSTTSSSTKTSLKTLESKNVSTLDRKNVSSIDRKSISSLEQKSLSKQEESGKKLLNNKYESSCDKTSNSVVNGGSPSESPSRSNKINIPAAFSCENTNTSSTKQLPSVRKSPYQTSRQNSHQNNQENSTENCHTKVNASPKHIVLDKGIAMRDPEEIKSLGGGLVKKRTELLTQSLHGITGNKNKGCAAPSSDRKNSLPKVFDLNNKGVILRKKDNKKFQLISKTRLQTVQKCPSKPKKLESPEIIFLLDQYQKAVKELTSVTLLDSESLQTESSDAPSDHNRPSSLIPDMTEEEEEGDSASSQSSSTTGYRPVPPPPRRALASTTSSDQTYDDIGNTPKIDECDDTYDDLNDFQENEKKREKERKDKEEKKRKEKEEKERKKQEKEEKKIKSKLKMDGSEQVVSEGTFTGETFKPGKLDLTLKKGDRINILRMDKNPAGKWLAKTEDGRFGYVESQLVEICASNIKNVMGVGQTQMQSSDYAPEEEEASQDDIYEEIPKV